MRYMIKKSYIDVVGKIWMPPAVCSMRYPVTNHDIENMRNEDGAIDRESVEQWVLTHSGDFQSIMDFSASLETPDDKTLDIPWATKDGEMAYLDTVTED